MKVIKSFYRFIFIGGYQALVLYRIAHKLHYRNIKYLSLVITRLNVMLNSIEINPQAHIAENVVIAHSVGVVIGGGCRIGKNVVIRQNVTIGQKGSGESEFNTNVYPTIGENVVIGAGACILGGITIGKNSIIGANAVVTKNVPENTVWVGIPAKQIREL